MGRIRRLAGRRKSGKASTWPKRRRPNAARFADCISRGAGSSDPEGIVMRLHRLVDEVRRSSAVALVIAMMACGNGKPNGTTPAPSTAPSANGNQGFSDSGSTPCSSASGGQGSSGSDAEPGAEADAESEGDASQSTSEAGDGSSEPDAAPACVKGQVTPDEV